MAEKIGNAVGQLLTRFYVAFEWYLQGGWKPTLIVIGILAALAVIIGFVIFIRRNFF